MLGLKKKRENWYYLKHKKVPPEIYCPGRHSLKDATIDAPHFEFTLERLIDGVSDGISGNITRTREAYDFEARLFKLSTDTVTRIDDFVTGLSYFSVLNSPACEITEIDPEGISAFRDPNNYTQIRDPERFFDLKNSNYQYNGQVDFLHNQFYYTGSFLKLE